MDIRQLRYFTAIFEQRNLSHAASLCGVAQSALSHHLGQLESELGVALFRRQARGMEPTAAGVRLHDHAKRLLRDLALAEQDLKSHRDEVAGEVVLGLSFSAIEGVAVPLMRAMIAEYPKVRLSLFESLSMTAFENLLGGAVDLALAYNPPVDQRVTALPLLEEELFCIGHADLIGDSGAPISFEDFAALPQILLHLGLAARAQIDRPALLQQLRGSAIMELNSVNALRKALVEGIGCVIAPRITVRDLLRTGVLQERPIGGPTLTRRLMLLRLAGRPPTILIEATQALLRRLIRAEVESGAWHARLIDA
ncbi:LysR family transcriptional regulator [Oceanibacterium hippocampi]|nr:LysR family transcriptional regulator [Oceanibacterium hippocampi]